MQDVIKGFRLSPQQSRIWTLQQETQNQEAFRVQSVLLLDGQLEPEVFRQALRQVVARHEILRTTFRRPVGVKKPLQVVLDDSEPVFSALNLSHLGSQEQRAKIEELTDAARRFHFDYEQGSLLHLQLLVLSDMQYALIITLPSLCMDSWTMRNLVHEIALAYAACLEGETLSDEPLKYVQFSEWQNELLEDEDEDSIAGKEHWQKQSQVDSSALQLPFENHSYNTQNFKPAVFASDIPPDITAGIEALARSLDATTQDVMLCCYLILLHKLTLSADISLALSCDGRRFDELRSALGLLARSVPLSLHFTPHARFSDLLAATAQRRHQAEQWQDYFSYEHLSTDAATPAIAAGTTMTLPFGFEWQEWPAVEHVAGQRWSISQQRVCIEPNKVKAVCIESESAEHRVQWQYDERVIAKECMERMAEQYEKVMREVTRRGGEGRIEEVEIVSERERRELIEEYNEGRREWGGRRCVHEMIEEQAKRTPDAVAVVFEDEEISYRELNRRANQVGNYLRKEGVEAESLVAVMMERSVEMVVALLGVLKAGGAYVPVDPEYPQERVRYMLEDSGAHVLLTQSRLTDSCPQITDRVICLDSEWEGIAKESGENRSEEARGEGRREVGGENLAYVIYTSGSTGRPKGVGVEHRQIVNYVNAVTGRLGLAEAENFAMVSTLAADLGNTVLFPSLTSGGCLHLISVERASDPDGLADYFQRHAIDCLKIVPSHFAALQGTHPEKIMPRRKLILGGEASRSPWVKTLEKASSGCEIYNHYGPTETTVGVLTYRVEAEYEESISPTLPLGRPLSNIQVYVLDAGRLVPTGVAGELYIGGAGVARGYLNRPELTAERFMPDPYGREAGGRLYRTGDRVRMLKDGNLEYLGRQDEQVKIRGYRIELGEIESVLMRHANIKEAVVVAREGVGGAGDKRLVAYVVSAGEQSPGVNEMRNHVQEHLPHYMVPSWYVLLKRLPLTPNGKVDRRALPEPEQDRPELETPYVAPRTEFEKMLAGIWSEVLGVERVGLNDGFFALGGDSILSVRVVALSKEKGLNFTIQQLFQHQTISELAAELRAQGAQTPQPVEMEHEDEDDEELARLLEEVNQLSEEEVLLKLKANMQMSETGEAQ
jgi:amino acid adenylation domain-containing protein